MIAICPHCGDELDVPAAFAGRPVRCGNCQSVFTPPGSEEPQPSAELPHRKSNGSVWGLVILTVLLTAPCTLCGTWGAFTILLPDFESVADGPGRFRAAFPGEPTKVDRATGDGTTIHGLELSRPSFNDFYFVYYIDLPAGVRRNPWNRQGGLDGAAHDLIEDVEPGRNEIRREETTHDGQPALDLLFDTVNPRMRLVVRCVRVGDRVYVAGVSGVPQANDSRARRFFAEFHVADAAK